MFDALWTKLKTAATMSAIVLLTGCSSWQVQPGPPDALIAEKNPECVRLTTVDGEQIALEAMVVRDSLIVGTRRYLNEYGVRSEERRAIPIAAVTKTEFKVTDYRLLRWTVGVAAFAGLVALIVAAVYYENPFGYTW